MIVVGQGIAGVANYMSENNAKNDTIYVKVVGELVHTEKSYVADLAVVISVCKTFSHSLTLTLTHSHSRSHSLTLSLTLPHTKGLQTTSIDQENYLCV